jgi:hypothetical protein
MSWPSALSPPGGGIEALIEATWLRIRENVLRLIDPAILVRAFENEAEAAAFAEPERDRLRRLVPDHQLLRRRVAGEPLRRLAAEYGVAHTTLGRWLKRPTVARQLRALAQRLPTLGAGEAGRNGAARGAQELLRKAAEKHAATIRGTSCPEHRRAAHVRVVEGRVSGCPTSQFRLTAPGCEIAAVGGCSAAFRRVRRRPVLVSLLWALPSVWVGGSGRG